MYWGFWENFDTIGPPAKKAFDHALALDPQNGEALTAKGAYTLHMTWDWREAQQFYIQALRSKAERSGMLQAYVNGFLLPLNQTDVARRLLEEAELKDHYSVPIKAGLALIELSEQRWEKAILKGKEMDYLEPDPLEKNFQCMGYYELGNQESIKTLTEDYEHLPNICNFYLELNKGNTIEAEAIAASLSLAAKLYPILGIFSATVELQLGTEEKAIDALEQVYNDRVAYSKYARFVPRLKANPRYQALLKKMNLDDASIAELEQTVDF